MQTPETQYILHVARSFPLLKGKLIGYNPREFDPNDFLRLSKPWSTTEIILANFVLTAWSRRWARENDRFFDLFAFLRYFDDSNPDRVVLMKWISNREFLSRYT